MHTATKTMGAGMTGKHLAVAAFAAAALLFSSVTSARAQENPKVAAAMQDLKADTAKLGAPKLDGDNLMFGSTKVNGDYTVVDAVKAKNGGTATLFAKKGDNFIRVSTNVIKDGNRAVGTMLDPTGLAIAQIRQGKPYYGPVDILGKIYDTAYEPIVDAGGQTVGIYYVGYSME